MTAVEATKRILIVEDDGDIRDVLAQVLELEGYEALTAENGKQALACLRGSKLPNLILLDLMMPVMDGWQFREAQLRNTDWASIPVLVLSAHGSANTKAKTVGVAGYLKKPVELETLLNAVKNHCGRS